MKTVCLIPARCGSKRVKDKNVKMLGGIPLMVWSIKSGLEIGETYVSTDSKAYGDIAFNAGAKVVYRDPVSDNQNDLEVLSHFLKRVSFDQVVYLRPTTPFRDRSLILGALANCGWQSLRSVELMSESAYKCFMICAGELKPVWANGEDLTDRPNQECPKTYHPNGYVDIMMAKNIKNGTLWGDYRQAFVTPRTIEIDSEFDFWLAERWIDAKNQGVERG